MNEPLDDWLCQEASNVIQHLTLTRHQRDMLRFSIMFLAHKYADKSSGVWNNDTPIKK